MYSEQFSSEGGTCFLTAGRVSNIVTKTDDRTGEIRASLDVIYMGGSEYLGLADPMDARQIKEGQWVVVMTDQRKIKDTRYPAGGTARILEVDGKPFKASAKGAA